MLQSLTLQWSGVVSSHWAMVSCENNHLKKLPKCKWPPCKRSSFYLLEPSPQFLPAPPCKVMHMCQSLRLISVSGPAICIVLTSCKYFIFHLFHAKPHQCEHNVVSLQRGCCGLIIFTIWKATSHTHVKENDCKHSLFYPSNWHANHAPPETGYTEILSLSSPMFAEDCNFAHGKVSPRTYNMGASENRVGSCSRILVRAGLLGGNSHAGSRTVWFRNACGQNRDNRYCAHEWPCVFCASAWCLKTCFSLSCDKCCLGWILSNEKKVIRESACLPFWKHFFSRLAQPLKLHQN